MSMMAVPSTSNTTAPEGQHAKNSSTTSSTASTTNGEKSGPATAPSTPQVHTTSDLNIDFLPQLYDIIRCLEKESQENTTQRMLLMREQPSDVAAKMQRLKESFDTFRTAVPLIPGIAVTRDEQMIYLRSLREQLVMKKELLQKYRNNNLIDGLNLKRIRKTAMAMAESNSSASS